MIILKLVLVPVVLILVPILHIGLGLIQACQRTFEDYKKINVGYLFHWFGRDKRLDAEIAEARKTLKGTTPNA